MQQLQQEMSAADRIRWANVLFWQASGLTIGGLIPTSLLVFLPDPTIERLLWMALNFVPFSAVIGGIVGTVIGIGDKSPVLGWRGDARRGPAPSAGRDGWGRRVTRLVLKLRPILPFASLCLALAASVLAVVHLGFSSLAPDRVVLGVQVWFGAKSPNPSWTDSFSLEDLCLFLILPCALLGSCLGEIAVFRRRVRRAMVVALAWNVGLLLYVGASLMIRWAWC
ncbi:MAG TPA: hypothetical protein VH682_22570 [Gemmataceae bacterium]|jgi:hypothetical protein